jgi:hypothetical protein
MSLADFNKGLETLRLAVQASLTAYMKENSNDILQADKYQPNYPTTMWVTEAAGTAKFKGRKATPLLRVTVGELKDSLYYDYKVCMHTLFVKLGMYSYCRYA